MTRRRQPRATSLIEVLLVITILGLFSLLAISKWPPSSRKTGNVLTAVARARSQAIHSFHPVSIQIQLRDTLLMVTAMPDGSVVGAREFVLQERARELPVHVQFPDSLPASGQYASH